MTISINAAKARAQLSELLRRAARGEEIVIIRAGKPVARIMQLADSTVGKKQRGIEVALRDNPKSAPGKRKLGVIKKMRKT